jgi:hypothetical protein
LCKILQLSDRFGEAREPISTQVENAEAGQIPDRCREELEPILNEVKLFETGQLPGLRGEIFKRVVGKIELLELLHLPDPGGKVSQRVVREVKPYKMRQLFEYLIGKGGQSQAIKSERLLSLVVADFDLLRRLLACPAFGVFFWEAIAPRIQRRIKPKTAVHSCHFNPLGKILQRA